MIPLEENKYLNRETYHFKYKTTNMIVTITPITITIYLLGYLVSYVLSSRYIRYSYKQWKKPKTYDWLDVLFSMIISIPSWLVVVAVLIGILITYIEKNNPHKYL